MIYFKRDKWIVDFKGRKFKKESEQEALLFLQKLEKEGLPNR